MADQNTGWGKWGELLSKEIDRVVNIITKTELLYLKESYFDRVKAAKQALDSGDELQCLYSYNRLREIQ